MILRVIRTAAKGSAAKTQIASLTSFYRSALVTCSGLGKRNLVHEMGHSIPSLFGFPSSKTPRVLQQAQERPHRWSFFGSEIRCQQNCAPGGDPWIQPSSPSHRAGWVAASSFAVKVSDNEQFREIATSCVCVALCVSLNLCVLVSSSVKA